MLTIIKVYFNFQCLEEWIKYCWCAWKFSTDHKVISTLLKVLYECNNEETVAHIQRLVVTLISISKTEEQKQIMNNLEKANLVKKANFRDRINAIKQEIKL